MESLYSSETDSEKENPDDEQMKPRRSTRLASWVATGKILCDTSDSNSSDSDQETSQTTRVLQTETPKRNPPKKRKRSTSKRMDHGESIRKTLLDKSSDSVLDHVAEKGVEAQRCKTSKRKKNQPEKESTKQNRTMLNKAERAKIIKSIKSMAKSNILKQLESYFDKEIKSRDLGLSNIIQMLLREKDLLSSLIEYHQTIFINLYHECSTGKEKYLRFQLEWHNHCSVLLLSYDSTVEKEITLSLWQKFCDLIPSELEKCRNVRILFSSAMYEILSKQVLCNEEVHSSKDVIDRTPRDDDSDDVYYRFGGATISEMLHVRYQSKKKASTSTRSIHNVSHEITILQSIKATEKSNMPNYLKYRDRGYMYTPHPSFIPFFRDIDNCIKEVVNPTGFQHHSHELVKVRAIGLQCMH